MKYTSQRRRETIESDLNLLQAKEILRGIPTPTDFVSSLIRSASPTAEMTFWIQKIALEWKSKDTESGAITGEFGKIRELFDKVKGLKHPRIIFQEGDMKICLSLAKPTSNNPSHVYVKANSIYQGKITPSGEFKTTRDYSPRVVEYIKGFNGNVLEFATKYGKRTGRCCFCDRILENDLSISLGMGPICRQNYGL